MKARVCRPGELGTAEVQRWRSFQHGDLRFENPFLSPDFAKVAGDVDDRVRVAVVEDGAAVVAFFPYTRSRGGVAKGVAPGVASCSGFLCAPDAGVDVPWLLRECGLHTWEFSDLAAPEPITRHAHVQVEPTHVVDLSRGYEHYLAEVRAHHRKFLNRLRKKRERLEAEQGEVTFTCEEHEPEVLRQLLAWKSAQYRASGWPDPFAKRWVVELISRLVDAEAPGLRGHLGALRAGGTLLAADFSLRSPSVFAGWLTAYNPPFGRYSPGMIQFLQVVEDVARHGVACIDLGVGDQAYKERFATCAAHVHRGYVDRGTARAVAWRAARSPRAHAENFVLAHAGLRSRVRSTLGVVGKLRTSGKASAELLSELIEDDR